MPSAFSQRCFPLAFARPSSRECLRRSASRVVFHPLNTTIIAVIGHGDCAAQIAVHSDVFQRRAMTIHFLLASSPPRKQVSHPFAPLPPLRR